MQIYRNCRGAPKTTLIVRSFSGAELGAGCTAKYRRLYCERYTYRTSNSMCRTCVAFATQHCCFAAHPHLAASSGMRDCRKLDIATGGSCWNSISKGIQTPSPTQCPQQGLTPGYEHTEGRKGWRHHRGTITGIYSCSPQAAAAICCS